MKNTPSYDFQNILRVIAKLFRLLCGHFRHNINGFNVCEDIILTA